MIKDKEIINYTQREKELNISQYKSDSKKYAIEKRYKERKTGGVLITFALLWWMLMLSSKGMSIKNSGWFLLTVLLLSTN